MDIIDHSYNKPYLEMSDSVYHALLDLKKFNYTYIYHYSMTREERNFYQEGMNKIYLHYLHDLEEKNKESIIYRYFLATKETTYLENTSLKRMVIDFIAGMTDDLFLHEIEKIKE